MNYFLISITTKNDSNSFIYSGSENLDAMAYAHHYNQTILDWIREGLKIEDTLADFGAGKGEFCNHFPSNQIIAVEPDERQRHFIHCPSYKTLEETNKRFDLIYAINVLEHIQDDQTIVKQFYERLKAGGRIKIFVPACQKLFSKMDEKVGHFRRYEKKGLIDLFISNGFQVARCQYFDFIGYYAAYFYKVFINKGEINAQQVIFYDKIIFPLSRFMDYITGGWILGKNLKLEAIKP